MQPVSAGISEWNSIVKSSVTAQYSRGIFWKGGDFKGDSLLKIAPKSPSTPMTKTALPASVWQGGLVFAVVCYADFLSMNVMLLGLTEQK